MTTDYEISSAVLTHPGRKRPHNEDFVAFFEPDDPSERQQSGRLYIVADGVGGEAKGEKASQFAAQKVLYDFYNDPDPDVGARLRRIMRNAGNDIYRHTTRGERRIRMATTMVAAVVRNGMLTVANVGDSRAYLIRGGQAKQITRDHTIAGEMLRDGEVTEEEAMRVRGKNRLTRSLGGEPDAHIDIFSEIELHPGDRVLLCSDGLSRYTLSDDVATLVTQGDPEEVVHRGIDYANQRGGADNITMALIDVGQPVAEDAITVRRGAVPTPIDWDELTTVPYVPMVQPSRRKFSTKQIALLSVVGIGVIAAFAFLLVVLIKPEFIRGLFPSRPVIAATETSAPIPATATVLVDQPVDTQTTVPTIIATTEVPMLIILENTSCFTDPDGSEEVGKLDAGHSYEPIERLVGDAWWMIVFPDGDRQCWVEASKVDLSGNTADIPTFEPTAFPPEGPPLPEIIPADLSPGNFYWDEVGQFCVYKVVTGDFGIIQIIERVLPQDQRDEDKQYELFDAGKTSILVADDWEVVFDRNWVIFEDDILWLAFVEDAEGCSEK